MSSHPLQPAKPPPIIIHLDMDAFYVSIEQLHEPSLRGRPVAVGAREGRGVVASASYEARQYGVRSAMSSARALQLCPHLVFVNSGYGFYSEYSRRIAAILRRFTPHVRMASQDEAYLDVSGSDRTLGPPVAIGETIRDAIVRETGLPCSLGISTRRTVSKIASALCKPRGLLWVPPGSEVEFLSPLPVGKMPGIGPTTRKRLETLGLRTLGDIHRLGPAGAATLIGRHGPELYQRIAGNASDARVEPPGDAKQVSHETTFRYDVGDLAELSSVLSHLSGKTALRLRRKGARGSTVVLKYRYGDFETHTASRTLACLTDDQTLIHRTALELLRASWDSARPLRLVGVGVSSLSRSEVQLDLLGGLEDPASAPAASRPRVTSALDAIRERHGDDVIHLGRSQFRPRSRTSTPFSRPSAASSQAPND